MEGLLSTGPTPSSFETQAEKVLKEVLTWVPKFFLDSREEAIFSSEDGFPNIQTTITTHIAQWSVRFSLGAGGYGSFGITTPFLLLFLVAVSFH